MMAQQILYTGSSIRPSFGWGKKMCARRGLCTIIYYNIILVKLPYNGCDVAWGAKKKKNSLNRMTYVTMKVACGSQK